jgi:ABC-type antimicrobial peptide transport system permease subunit
VSPQFLEIFTFPLVTGSSGSAMKDIHSILVSETLAKKYFGSSQLAIGQNLQINNNQDFTVTGVFQDTDKRSSFTFDWLIPAEEYIQRNDWVESWFNGGFRIVFTLKKNADLAAFSKKVEQETNEHTNHTADERLFPQLFSDRYLHSVYKNGKVAGGRIDYIKLFFAIALFTTVIACINFMNLVTARSVTRAKEVGLRKVMGANRAGLGIQFLTESMTTACISVMLSVAITFTLLPSFNRLTGKNIILDFSNPMLWVLIIGLVFFTGILSGSYPAFLLPEAGGVQLGLAHRAGGRRAQIEADDGQGHGGRTPPRIGPARPEIDQVIF